MSVKCHAMLSPNLRRLQLSMTEHDETAPLPAPISLTFEEALRVAGGSTASPFLHAYIINGIPAEYWNVAKSLPLGFNPAAGGGVMGF